MPLHPMCRPRRSACGRLPGHPRPAQFDPEAVNATLTAVAAGEVHSFRDLEPASMVEETKQLQPVPWDRKVTDGLGTRHPTVQRSYEMEPETPVRAR